MDTKLVNSQLVSRRDVKVWFWDGEREYSGEVRAIADNGIWIEAKGKRPADGTIQSARAFLNMVKRALIGKAVTVELTSPRTKGEVRAKINQVDLVSTKQEMFSIIGEFASPPDPTFLKILLEPMVTKAPPKK